jgi:hypothetical protein
LFGCWRVAAVCPPPDVAREALIHHEGPRLLEATESVKVSAGLGVLRLFGGLAAEVARCLLCEVLVCRQSVLKARALSWQTRPQLLHRLAQWPRLDSY